MTQDHFQTLAAIVCDTYGVPVDLVLSKRREITATTPRNIIAAIWRNGNSLSDTAIRCGWKHAASVCHAQARVDALLHNPSHAYRIERIMAEVAEKLPWLAIENPEN